MVALLVVRLSILSPPTWTVSVLIPSIAINKMYFPSSSQDVIPGQKTISAIGKLTSQDLQRLYHFFVHLDEYILSDS